MLRRPCPERGNYSPSTWVMIWRTTTSKSQEWIGPQRIILQDSNQTVWTTQAGKLYRSAPENVRLAHPSEGDREDGLLPEDITSIQQQITRMNQSLPVIPETEEMNNPIDTDNPNNPTQTTKSAVKVIPVSLARSVNPIMNGDREPTSVSC